MPISFPFALVLLLAAAVSGCVSTPPRGPTDACARVGPAADANAVCPLLPGMSVPDVAVTDLDGAVVSLASLAQKPTVIIFYRGGWCPFCNVQMGQLQAIEADIRAAGFEVVGISPDDAPALKASIGKHSLSYRLLSDTPMRAANGFGVGYTVDAGMGLALRAMAPQHNALPVPAVFVVDKGIVRFSYANPNFKVRLAPELLMAAVRSAKASSAP